MKRIAILVFADAQLLDAAGPASVFGKASLQVAPAHYEVLLVSSIGGEVQTDCGVAVMTRATTEVAPASIDTLIVVGGEGPAIAAALRDRLEVEEDGEVTAALSVALAAVAR